MQSDVKADRTGGGERWTGRRERRVEERGGEDGGERERERGERKRAKKRPRIVLYRQILVYNHLLLYKPVLRLAVIFELLRERCTPDPPSISGGAIPRTLKAGELRPPYPLLTAHWELSPHTPAWGLRPKGTGKKIR